MSDMAFEQYTQQIDFLQIFQLKILQKKINEILSRREAESKAAEANDIELFEHFSGLGAGIDANHERKAYFEDKYGSIN